MTTRVRNTTAKCDETLDVGPPGPWANRASCGGMIPSLLDFFGGSRIDWGLSKRVCKACPVRRECLGYALEGRLVHGVWGGLDPLELRFAVGRDAGGKVWTYSRDDVKCVYCRGDTLAVRADPLDDKSVDVTRSCVSCGFTWTRAERVKSQRARRRRRPAVPQQKAVTSPTVVVAGT